MTFFWIYLALGCVAAIWYLRGSKAKTSDLLSGLDENALYALIFMTLLWPLVILVLFINFRITEGEREEREKRKVNTPEDLSLLHGKTGVTKTKQSPSGKVIIEDREYESQSTHTHIEKGIIVRVVGHSMRHLKIEAAEPGEIANT